HALFEAPVQHAFDHLRFPVLAADAEVVIAKLVDQFDIEDVVVGAQFARAAPLTFLAGRAVGDQAAIGLGGVGGVAGVEGAEGKAAGVRQQRLFTLVALFVGIAAHGAERSQLALAVVV